MRPASNRRERPSEEWVAEFTLSRVFDAPRDMMFRIWTDPQYVQLWWGLEGTTNPVCELDVRVGGSWRIDMRMANGTVYQNGGEYLEVVENERLVSTDIPGAALPGGIDGIGVLDMLREATARGPLQAVLHSFTGTLAEAEEAVRVLQQLVTTEPVVQAEMV